MVTQPSVSAAVAALEREVGVQLTERAGRGIKPTPAGLAYARYASDVMSLLREGSEAAAEAARGVTDRVRVAAVTTAGEYLLPALIRGFREYRPDLDVSVYVDNRQEVFRQLGAREADVAISGRPPEDGGFEGTPFLENEFVLIAEPTDPMARRPWVPVAELAERPWLMREQGSGTRRLCEAYLRLRRWAVAAHARLERRDQERRTDRARDRASVPGRGGTRARLRAPRDDPAARRPAQAPVACREVHGGPAVGGHGRVRRVRAHVRRRGTGSRTRR